MFCIRLTKEDKEAIAQTRNPGMAMRMIEHSQDEYLGAEKADYYYMCSLTDAASNPDRKYKPDCFLPNGEF
jgi:hypothetical protein